MPNMRFMRARRSDQLEIPSQTTTAAGNGHLMPIFLGLTTGELSTRDLHPEFGACHGQERARSDSALDLEQESAAAPGDPSAA